MSENGTKHRPVLTTLWFYLFAIMATLLLSLTVGGIFYQLCEGLFDFNLEMSNAVRALAGDRVKLLVLFTGAISVSALGLLIAVPLGVCGAIYLQCHAQRNWARQLLQSGVDTLTRLPAIIIGIYGFYLCTRLGLGWGVVAQSFIFALMLLPTTMNTAGIALDAAGRECNASPATWDEVGAKVMDRARPGIFSGIVMALVRVWCELIITLYAATVALALIGGTVREAANFGDLFRLTAEASLDVSTVLGKTVTLLILVAVLNAFVNWLLKNFALREHWKAKQPKAQN